MINFKFLKFYILKLISNIENRKKVSYYEIDSQQEIYILFLKNLGLGDMIMLSPLINLLRASNLNKIVIVSHFPNIFDEKLKRISFFSFLKQIFFKKNFTIISPSVNFLHSLFIFFPCRKIGFFSSSTFFSNILKFKKKFEFDPIYSHYNHRLFPFIEGLCKSSEFTLKYPEIKSLKPTTNIDIEKSIIICPFKIEKSMKWPEENFIDLIKEIKSRYTDNVCLISGKDKNSVKMVKKMSLKANIKYLNFSSIPEINYIINNCNLFIGLDNFMSHLSFFSDRPSIIIYGSTSSKLRTPKNIKNTFFLEHENCSQFPSWDSVQSMCINVNDHLCIESIKPSDVIKKIDQLALTF